MDSKTASIAGAIVIAGALIAGAILYTKQPAQEKGPVFTPENLRAVTVADHRLGPIDADVTLVVFTDLECPYCKVWHETVLKLSAQFPDLAVVYRHFPIETRHKKAKLEAQATECAANLAGEAGFWNMVSGIFESTASNDGLNLDLLPELAKKAGVTDTAVFAACLENNETKERVETDLAEAVATGGGGTPWNIMLLKKGDPIPFTGAIEFDAIAPGIEQLLKEQQG